MGLSGGPAGSAAAADTGMIGRGRGPIPSRIPLSLKLAYSAFMAVLLPVYLTHYGPTNFLYFCDIALILTLVGIWAESALLVSICAAGILAPQLLWAVDFLAQAAGTPLTGMTAYMFNAETSPFLRGLSLFHGWLPFLLVFLVWRLGYDRRAWGAWSALAVILLFVCFFLMPPPRPDPGDDAGQHQLCLGHERHRRADVPAGLGVVRGSRRCHPAPDLLADPPAPDLADAPSTRHVARHIARCVRPHVPLGFTRRVGASLSGSSGQGWRG
ncbi:membrane protein of unknown function [Methylorubrum extorquens]|uniref:Uncharacterized protein n=1 Tax=Methylorubrum extorquens TaxID=408 RepID=A0A2N9AKB3_METEX|nr:membrane protein of unknown function [Methylorubrum extorquens]